MAKDFAKQFYQSKAWKKCRESYVNGRRSWDGGLCEQCHQNLGYILHHKIVLTPQNINDSDVTLNPCNLMYVCKDCHDDIHYKEIHGFERKQNCSFDVNGNPIDIRTV